MLSKILFALSRQPILGYLVRFGFQYASFLIPVKKILNNAHIISFFHPRQFYDHHILIVPKKSIRTPLDLAENGNSNYAVAILSAAGKIVQGDRQLQGKFILCMNGGSRQDVPQIHFHLFIGERYVNELGRLKPEKLIISGQAIKIFHHPDPNWEIHILMIPNEDIFLEDRFSPKQKFGIQEAFKVLPELNSTFKLAEKGYTIYLQEERTTEKSQILFHIAVGKRLPKSTASYSTKKKVKNNN